MKLVNYSMLCVTRWYELLTHKLENDKCELELKVWSERLFEAKKKEEIMKINAN